MSVNHLLSLLTLADELWNENILQLSFLCGDFDWKNLVWFKFSTFLCDFFL